MAKLLHITPNEYPALSVEHSTKQIWKELAKDYEEYHIIGRSQDQHFHTEQEGKLFLHRVPKLNGNKSFLFTSLLLPYYLKKYKIDVMLAQCAILGGIAGVFYGKIYHVPIMIEIHGVDYFNFLDGKTVINRIIAIFLRWVYGNATRVRALNPYMQQMLKTRGIKANIIVIQNRVNLSLFEPPKNDYRLGEEIKIICVGTFVKLKGHQLLINAAKQLSKKYPVKVILVGGGELMRQYIEETNGWNNFEFYERIPQGQLVWLLRNADFYVHTSYREAVPRAIIEAMAMGLPIITTDAGMIRGLIQNRKNGMLIPIGDQTVLEETIKDLIKDDVLREKIGRQAYVDAKEHYEWDKNFQCYRTALWNMREEYKKTNTKYIKSRR